MTRNKIANNFIFVLSMLPLLLVILSVFRSGTFEIGTIASQIKVLYENIPLINDIYTWVVENLLNSTGNSYIYIIFGYLTYLFLVEIIVVFFDILLIIPRIIRKVVYSYDKEK